MRSDGASSEAGLGLHPDPVIRGLSGQLILRPVM
jgi:hypothetical protein